MTSYKGKVDLDKMREDILRRREHGDPAVTEYFNETMARYGKYLLSPKEARRVIDEAMGDHTLTEILEEMREEGY